MSNRDKYDGFYHVDTYKGVEICTGIVCFSIRYFIMDEFFSFQPSLEKAKQYIDEREEKRKQQIETRKLKKSERKKFVCEKNERRRAKQKKRKRRARK